MLLLCMKSPQSRDDLGTAVYVFRLTFMYFARGTDVHACERNRAHAPGISFSRGRVCLLLKGTCVSAAYFLLELRRPPHWFRLSKRHLFQNTTVALCVTVCSG